MRKLSLLVAALLPASTLAGECDCTSYPFKPNPPCFSQCSEKLSKGKIEMSSVKNIDAGVKASIDKLSTHDDPSSIDFSEIHDKLDLEKSVAKISKEKKQLR